MKIKGAKSSEWEGWDGGKCLSTGMHLSVRNCFAMMACDMSHDLDAESITSSSRIPTFSFSLILGAWSGSQSSTFD
jgi:hypothetical protein